MKKCFPIIFAVLLTVGMLIGHTRRNFSSGQNGVVLQSNETAINRTVTPTDGALCPTVSPDASAAYKKLIAYRTKDYGQQSIADFHMALASTPDELTEFLAAEADVISNLSLDDENYDFFTTTMSFSSNELYCEHRGEEFTFYASISKQSRLCDYLDEEGDAVYGFNCFVDLQVGYSINDPKLVTVAERDNILLTFEEEMGNYLNGLSEAEIIEGNIGTMIIDKSVELANSLSTENMELSPCEIVLLSISGA